MKRQLPSLEESLHILRTTRTKRMPKAPPPITRQVQPLVKSLQARFEQMDDGSGKLKNRWPEIVGESLAKLCEPVRIIKGRTHGAGALEIRVMGAYAPLVQHQSATLIDRINLFLGARTIDRLRLIQGPLTQTAKKPPAPPKPKPLSAQEELALQQSLSDVADEKLKKSLLQLGRSILKHEKSRL
ncbi:MAG: DciA family protein [Asticcacaulis sp.]|uniref:DUF721 domain-containing protein n=1 Tax=Asticcacaulis sp. TaxID=1872648 RepID=UPI0039E399DF